MNTESQGNSQPDPARRNALGEIEVKMANWGERVGAAARSVTSALAPTGTNQSAKDGRTELEPGDRRQRAERLVDNFSDWAKRYGAAAGKQVQRAAARAREEAEDIWAEAQALRDRAEGSRSPADPTPSGNSSAATPQPSSPAERSRITDDVFTSDGMTG